MQRLLRVIVLTSVALVPATVFAQASIVGTVRDASGAVLPGVTVEASSPALIEKTRSVVSSGTGQYAIEDLRPGTYTVTFSLSGFTTVRREGIELAGSFIATVNVDGSPNVSPKGTFLALDDRTLAFAEMRSPATVENVTRDMRVEVNMVDGRHGGLAAAIGFRESTRPQRKRLVHRSDATAGWAASASVCGLDLG